MTQPSSMQRAPPTNKLQILHQKLGQQAPDVRADAEQLLEELKAEALQVSSLLVNMQVRQGMYVNVKW
jgi:hypothetical protein